ncbi:DUF262 domain-containing HNH endonuclease family protein [Arthrobacter sp. FW305-123]|nr:DUF262 domain-containing HNH endonuclease family protein [Arthrobacter sp. FW305-123]
MAKKGELASDPISLGQRLADDVQLVCPLFQRRYVWRTGEIDQLWEDIDSVLDGSYERRFLGALVFDDELASSASSAGKYLVIDGQQRLTTLVLTIVALAERSMTLGAAGQQLGRDLYEQYLVSRKANTKNQPKLSPTLADTRQFNEILRNVFEDQFDLDIDPLKETGDDVGVMTDAYRTIRTHIHSRTSPAPGLTADEGWTIQQVEKLRDVLLDQLEFVEIRLGDEHDPNEVFDRLNKEGVRLGIIDLVRNEVLKRLGDDAKLAMQLYSQEWKPFEESFHSENAKSGYFYPFALTVDASITKAKTFSTLTKRWNAMFQGTEQGSEVGRPELTPKDELKEIMADLRTQLSSYNAVASGRLSQVDEELREHVRRLVDLNSPTVTYPYLMQLLTAHSSGLADTDDVIMCLSIIESFLVRRGLRGIEPTGLHAIFKKMWGVAGADPSRVRKAIVSTTVVYPNDEDVRAAILGDNLYKRKICRYVISEYERHVSTGDVLDVLPEITVDHLMPQAQKGAWLEAVPKADFDRVVNTWGNLVPLSSAANSTKGAKDWTEAKKLLSTETVFSSTKQVYSQHDDWNAETIEARSANIAIWALDRWPYFLELMGKESMQTVLTSSEMSQ